MRQADAAGNLKQYGDRLVVVWVIEQMNSQDDKPLFLAVGRFRPHIPWEVSLVPIPTRPSANTPLLSLTAGASEMLEFRPPNPSSS